MEGFNTLDFIGDIYDISIGWVKPPNAATTVSCRRLILNMSHWTTLLWYSIPLIYHNLTEIRHGSEGWLWYEQLSPGPITVQWGSGLNCMLAKQNVLLVNSRHELYHPFFSYTLPVFAQWHGLYPQVTNVACHCMGHGNNDHCDQCQSKKNLKIVRRYM